MSCVASPDLEYRAGVDRVNNSTGRPPGDGQPDPVPTLSYAIRLRPFAVAPGAGADTLARFADDRNDTTTSVELESAEFALFSSGPDKGYEPLFRSDLDREELNRDNIVEVGP